MRGRAAAIAVCAGLVAASATLHGLQVPAQLPGLSPSPPAKSDLRVRLDRVGVMPTHINPTSPVVAGDQLLLIDQAGALYRWDGRAATPVMTAKSLPAGVKPFGGESLINVAADRTGTHLYAMFVSSSAPKDLKRLKSPRNPDALYVLVDYAFDGQTVSSPRPIVALEMRSEGHTGGGLIVADDGAVLFAVGDNGDSFEDGRDYGHDVRTHLAKIMRIAPSDGSVSVAALGVRAAQRLAIGAWGGERWLTFADPGGWVSEEMNAVRLSELASSTPPDFGWGRHPADGKSREGLYEIDNVGQARARSRDDEPGFVQPCAEFGRTAREAIAVSGPVAGSTSFSRITLLFGDLVSGRVFATTGPITERRQTVFEVGVVDAEGKDTTLKALAGNARPDPRFFSFPDGTAGVLLEKTGEFFRVTELR